MAGTTYVKNGAVITNEVLWSASLIGTSSIERVSAPSLDDMYESTTVKMMLNAYGVEMV